VVVPNDVCGSPVYSISGWTGAALPKGETLVVEGDHESTVRNPEPARAVVRFFVD
jgi:hypothetical protein